MLIIRQAQLNAFVLAKMDELERSAFLHVQSYFPEQCMILGEESTRRNINLGLKRARGYGLESASDLIRYVNLVFALGDDFASNGQYPWAAEILANNAYSPKTKIDLLTQLAMSALGFHSTESEDDEVISEEETEEFDGIIWEEEESDSNAPISLIPEELPEEPPIDDIQPWQGENEAMEEAYG